MKATNLIRKYFAVFLAGDRDTAEAMMSEVMILKNKNAIIHGAGRAIGAPHATGFLASRTVAKLDKVATSDSAILTT